MAVPVNISETDNQHDAQGACSKKMKHFHFKRKCKKCFKKKNIIIKSNKWFPSFFPFLRGFVHGFITKFIIALTAAVVLLLLYLSNLHILFLFIYLFLDIMDKILHAIWAILRRISFDRTEWSCSNPPTLHLNKKKCSPFIGDDRKRKTQFIDKLSKNVWVPSCSSNVGCLIKTTLNQVTYQYQSFAYRFRRLVCGCVLVLFTEATGYLHFLLQATFIDNLSLAAIFINSLSRRLLLQVWSGSVVYGIFLIACLKAVVNNAVAVAVHFLGIKQSIRQRGFTKTGTMASPSSSSTSSSSMSPPLSISPLPEGPIRDGGNLVMGSGVKSASYPPPRVTLGEAPVNQQLYGMAKRGNLNCQMDWITDLMPMYLTSSEKRDYFKAIVKGLVEWLEDMKDVIVTPGVRLNVRMMLACFHAYLDQFNEALDWINAAVDNLKIVSDKSGQHLRAYSYLLQLNFFKINRRMKLMEGMSMKLVDQGAVEERKEIEGMYSENQGSFQAAIWFAKGLLAKIMTCQDKQIEWYRNAVKLEPNCAHWHRGLYSVLRKQRRERGGRDPSFEEKMAITNAFDLDSDCCLNQALYAGMLEERMKSKQEYILDENKAEMGNQIISLMESALDKNPEDKWAHVRLAEVYAYGYFPHLNPKDGELMFEDLEERWPDNSMVLHKFGRYFVVTVNNPSRALDYYSLGLKNDPANFPCLMDFLKTSKTLGKGYEFMLEMVEKCSGPEFLYNSAPFVKMMLAKGILLWLLDNNDGGTGKQEACEAWIEAAEKDPSACIRMAKIITSGYSDVVGEFSIDVMKLTSILKVFLSRARDQGHSDQIRAIERLISELQHHDQPFGGGQQRNRAFSTSSSRSSMSNCSFATAKTSFSQADSVTNWRAAPPQIPPLMAGTGVFAKYEDPMELRFRGGFSPGFKLGLTAAPQLHKSAGGGGGGDSNNNKTSIADMDNDWRR